VVRGQESFQQAWIFLGTVPHGCPCGFYTDPNRECTCTMPQILRYQSKISGPLMDRIDIHVEVPAVKYRDLTGEVSGEDSEAIKNRVNRARGVQRERFTGKKIHANAQMTPRHLKKYCQIEEASKTLLGKAIDKFGLSARAYTRILKIARTIADLEGVEDIATHHISESIQYRSLGRTLL
jgi:magnesium chelatase family protein